MGRKLSLTEEIHFVKFEVPVIEVLQMILQIFFSINKLTQLASSISDSSYHCQVKGCFNPLLLKGYKGPKRRLCNLLGKCKVYGKNMLLYEHLEKSLFCRLFSMNSNSSQTLLFELLIFPVAFLSFLSKFLILLQFLDLKLDIVL